MASSGRNDSEYLIREAMRKAQEEAERKAAAEGGAGAPTGPGGVPPMRRRRRAPDDHEKSDGLEQSGWEPLKLLARGSAEHGVVVHLCTANEKGKCESQGQGQGDQGSRTEGATGAETEEAPPFVAVKVVPRWSLDERASRRLVAEVELLTAAGQADAARAHPNLMRYYGQVVDPDFHYLSLEALVGGPLHKHLRAGAVGARGGRGAGTATFSCGRALYYAAQIAGAVQHMHAAGIVHRDIKGSNVVLDHRGNTRLVDFGFAKMLDGSGGDTPTDPKDATGGGAGAGGAGGVGGAGTGGGLGGHSWARTKSFCGTPHAMAPEMIGRQGHGYEVDWWALGILLWEMLVGTPPFGYGGEKGGREGLYARINGGVDALSVNPCPPPPARPPNPNLPLPKDLGNLELMAAEYGEELAHMLRRFLDPDPATRLGTDIDEVQAHSAWTRVTEELGGPPAAATESPWEVAVKAQAPPRFRSDLGAMEHFPSWSTPGDAGGGGGGSGGGGGGGGGAGAGVNEHGQAEEEEEEEDEEEGFLADFD